MPKYATDQYSFLDDVYCMIPLTLERDPVTNKCHWYHGDQSGYSQRVSLRRYPTLDARSPDLRPSRRQFLGLIQEISEFKHPAIKNNLPAVATPPDDYVLKPVVPYLPSEHKYLHMAPQAWMFTPEWQAANPALMADIAPVDEPTDPADIKTTNWYLQHAKGWTKNDKPKGKAAAKRKQDERSASVLRDDINGDSGTSQDRENRSRSASTSSYGPFVTPGPEHTQKRRRMDDGTIQPRGASRGRSLSRSPLGVTTNLPTHYSRSQSPGRGTSGGRAHAVDFEVEDMERFTNPEAYSMDESAAINQSYQGYRYDDYDQPEASSSTHFQATPSQRPTPRQKNPGMSPASFLALDPAITRSYPASQSRPASPAIGKGDYEDNDTYDTHENRNRSGYARRNDFVEPTQRQPGTYPASGNYD